MRGKSPRPEADHRKIARLVRTIREAEKELQELAGGQLDAVVSEGDAPYLLRDAQAKLRASEAAQRTLAETQIGILNALPAHIALLDSRGVILEVNEAWRRFATANLLRSADFCVGQSYLEVCENAVGECADDAQSVAEGIRRVLRGDAKGFSIEYPCHSPTEERWFRLMVTPLSEATGVGAVVMHINVTERRLAEEVLRQKEREQRRLAEQLTLETRRLHESQAVANIGSWETALATFEVKWTDETFRIFETSPEQFEPTHEGFLERVHPEDRRMVDDAFMGSIGRAGSFAIEHRLLFPDGRVKFVEERWQVFDDATGRPVRAVGTCQDITERKAAEELAKLRARQQETIARIGFEATRATTREGVFELATRAVAEALGVELCKVLQLAPDGSHLRLVSGVGWQAGLIGVATVGVDRESQAGFTLKSDGAVYVNDFAQETRFVAPPLLREHGVVSGLSVKIMLRDKPWGVLGAHSVTPRTFNDVDADFMEAVAALLAVVIERLAIQQTLTESEARMRDAQRIAHLGNWELDLATNELTWSDEMFRIFGVEPSAFTGTYEGFLALVHPDDRDAMQAAQQAALLGRELLEIEHRVVRPDGSIRHVRERGELIHDENGRPVALSGTALDATDLRSAQSRAEQMNALLTEAQRIANMGSWEMDLTSGRLVWSEETCRLFGISPEEFGGTFEAFTAFILPEDRAGYGAVHDGITPEAPLLEAEYRIRRPDGEVRWMFERGRVTFNAAGKPVRRLGVVMDVTARKQAEAKLRESEERFRLMIEGSEQVLFYTHDREHRFDYLSPSTRDVLGYEPEELVGQPFDLLVISDDPLNADVGALTDQALRDGEPSEPYLAVVRHKDGSRIVLEILESPVFRDGEIAGIQGFARDITERETVRAAVAESQRQYRDLVETSHNVIWSVDLEGRFTFVNQAVRSVFGREPYEMVGRRYHDFVPEDQHRANDEVLERMLLDGGDVVDYSNRIRRKDGTIAILRSNARVARDQQGQVIGISGMSQDITEEIRAQEAIAQSEARFRGLFEQAAVGMCLASTEGAFLRTNARFCEIVGYTAEELLERDSIETTHPDDRGREAETVSRMLAGELQTAAWEKRYLHKDGHAVWCHLTLSLLPGPDGRERQFVAVIEDITERRAALERLRQSEQLLRLAGHIARMGAWSVDFPDVRIVWSDEVCAIHGMPAGTVPALDQALDFYAPESRPVIEAAFSLCASEGKPFDLELELLSASGRRKWVRSIGQAERDDTGAIRRVHGAFQDITEQKQAEAEVLRAAETLAGIVEVQQEIANVDLTLTDVMQAMAEHARALTGAAGGAVEMVDGQQMVYAAVAGNVAGRVGFRLNLEGSLSGLAAANGTVLCSDETETDPRVDRAACRTLGVRSMVVAPLHVAGEIVGVLKVLSGKPGAFGKRDIHNLQILAETLGVVIQRHRADEALRASHRALQMLSRCNEALIRSELESELLEAICRIAVDIGGFRLAWVGYALGDAQKTIACQSHAGGEEGFLTEARITWDENDPCGRGPAGTVIRLGTPVVVPDLETDECYRPWLEAARARGFRSAVALPLTDESRAFGVFVLYRAEAREPLPDEMRLLQELADDMAFGILTLRARSDRQRMHTAVERVAASVSAVAGTDFFEQLTRNMVAALGAKAGFVAQVLPGEPLTARTIAVVADDQVAANFDYVLEGTPCERLFASETCVIHQKVASQFPRSPTLLALEAEGFVGRRLDDASGAFLGQIVALFSEPLDDPDFVMSTLQIFAARAAAELERQETDTRLREQAALLDKAQDAILVRDLDHNITYWNNSAARLYGWSAQEAVGRSERELLYSEPGMFDRAAEALMAHGEWTGELRHQRKDGQILEVEGRWTLVRSSTGQAKTVLAIHTDVTERRQHERLAQRSQRLESIGTLAGGIAHDLNNALTPIMMSGELLRMEYPGESQLLDTIQSCAKRGADMVGQLLTFARGAEGERIPLQLGRLLKELENLVQGSFPKNIRLVVRCEPRLSPVLGNPTQVHQVLLNLCVNARDAMPNGGTLTLKAESQGVDAVYASSIPDARPGEYVALSVGDTGTGIAPDVLDRIFDPFFTTKAPDKGTGLGLSTVLGIVKGHGGFLRVQSQPGQGSVFTVHLPAHDENGATQVAPEPAVEFRGQGETILVVDDEPTMRETTRTVLQRLNFRPLTALDGADGLMQAAQHRSELRAIITDLAMPHMDGLAFVRALRGMLPDIPVLLASGWLEEHVAAEFRALGVTSRLDKPFTAAQLGEALEDLLRSN